MHVRAGSFQWAAGAFCAVVGALMLMAPHQFAADAYVPLQPELGGWGAIFLLGGIALFGSQVFRPPAGLLVAIRLLACALLLTLAAGFAAAGGWAGTLTYALLAAGLGLLALMAVRDGHDHSLRLSKALRAYGGAFELDLLVAVLALSAALLGLLLLAVPGQFAGQVAPGAVARAVPLLRLLGLALLAGGLPLLLLQWPRASARATRGAVWAAHLAAAAAYLVFLVGALLPDRAWLPILYYGGFGLVLAILPIIEPHRHRLNPTNLQTRVALLLVVVATVPVIFTAALAGDQEERMVRQEALERQARLAQALVHAVSSHVELQRSALSALAAHPGLLRLPPAEQQALLDRYSRIYPEINAFTLFDATGRVLATSRSDSAAADFLANEPRFESNGSVRVVVSPEQARPLFSLGVPVFDEAGQVGGLLWSAVDSGQVAGLLAQQVTGRTTLVYLVDEAGRTIFHPDPRLVAEFAELAGTPAVAGAMRMPGEVGALDQPTPEGGQLVGFARAPGLGWTVVVERPVQEALAAVRSAREVAFGILLLALLLTLGIGVALAGWVARPLSGLAGLARDLAAGRSGAPLPRSEITEVAQLAEAFGDMRDRLAVRTAELQRSEAQLRQLSARLQALQESERLRTAREVHDELGGSLATLKVYASQLGRLAAACAPELQTRTGAMARLIDDMVQKVRRIATDLRPGLLDDLGLAAAIEWHVQEFAARTGLDWHFEATELPELDHDCAVALFRVLQEALENVARHAQASRVEVALRLQEGLVLLRVRDDGRGILPDEAAGPRALGLLGMRERAQLLGGWLSISGQPGEGTLLEVRVPYVGAE
jgi:signal transduction histidine kinase